MSFELLVRHHPADEQDVGPGVVEQIGDRTVRRHVEMGKIRHDGQDAGPPESKRLEVLPIELGIAEGEVTPVGVGSELASSVKTFTAQRTVQADEKLGWGDVVIDERHAIGQRKGHAGRLGGEREVM